MSCDPQVRCLFLAEGTLSGYERGLIPLAVVLGILIYLSKVMVYSFEIPPLLGP